VSAGTAAALQNLAGASSADFRNLAISSAQMREMRSVVNTAIAGILGRRPKTLRYLPL
jgi:hypothetical protein